MNFLKQILQLNPCQHNDSDKSPQQSGEFQIISIQQNYNPQSNKQNIQEIDLSLVCAKNFVQKDCQQKINDLQKNQQKYMQNNRVADQLKQLNQKLSKQYTIIELDDDEIQQKCNGSASTIKIDEYYMIVNTQQLTKKFITPQQWMQFFRKINCFHKQINKFSTSSNNCVSNSQTQSEKKKTKISLTIKELNSILQIKPEQLSLRQIYWNSIAYPPDSIRFKYTQLANKKDPKKLQKNVNKIMESNAEAVLYEIVQKKYKDIDSVQDQLERWKCHIIKLLNFYGANDRQIGYSQGLQYLALGILVSKPFSVKAQAINGQTQQSCYFNSISCGNSQSISPTPLSSVQQQYTSLQLHFKYLLFTKQLRNMYFPGTPKLYQEIQFLKQWMRNQVSQLYELLQKSKVDQVKLFRKYYKTFLLYNIKNPQVIRKIMELLLVYGIDIVRVLLTRIMNRNQKKILLIKDQTEQFKYLSEELVLDYFGDSDTQQVIQKFKELFILNIDK